MAEQVPQIPEVPFDEGPETIKETVTSQVTLNDLPPPGAIFQRKLTDREIVALKGFGSDTLKFLNEVSKDMLPGIGEARAVEYTNQEIEGLKKALKERDVPGTVVHGIGVPLMSAGTLPYWLGGGVIGGAAAFLMRDIIGKGYRNLTARFRSPQEAFRQAAQQPTGIDPKIFEQPGAREATKRAETTINKKNVPVKITEKFNYGQSSSPVRTGLSKSPSEFQGSRTYDVLAQTNFKGMSTDQMVGTMINLIRKGKISKDELFDAGVLKLDENLKPVGGAIYEMPKELKQAFGKQELLKMLQDSPSNRLKVTRYGTPSFDDGFFDLYASTDIMIANLKGSIQEKLFQNINVAQRRPLLNAGNALADIQRILDRGVSRGKFLESSNAALTTQKLQSLRELIPSLSTGDAQIMRALINNLEKVKKKYLTKDKTFKDAPKHEGQGSTKGGDDYNEVVIHLDESIVGNKEPRRVYGTHFNEANPIVFTLQKTRYNQKGDPILFAEEIQSDPIQQLFGEGKGNLRKMMNNPYSKNLIESVIRKRIKDLSEAQTPLIKKSQRVSLSQAEVKQLQQLNDDKATLRKYFQKSELMDDQGMKALQRILKDDVNRPDYIPYLNQYYKLAIRQMIDDAIRTGKKGISILPVTTYKGKSTHHTKDQGHYLYYGDEKGLKTKAFDKDQLPGPKTKKKAGDAVYIETMKKIAKEIEQDYGLKLPISKQKIYSTSFKKGGPFVIVNPNGTIMAGFKKKTNRDYILQKLNSNRSASDRLTPRNITDDPGEVEEMFTSIVMEIPDNAAKMLRKKKMRSYKTGGLVAIEPKREYFAPIF